MSQKEEGFKLAWLLPIVVSLIISFAGFYTSVQVANANAGNIERRVSKLEILPDTVSRMSANIETIQQQQTEIRQDIKALLQRGR